jgi:hypothetical protein
MSVEFKVPRLLWENLESVLYAHSKRYIIELAQRLKVSEKELLKQVLPSSDKCIVTMLDSQAESNQCKAYIQHDKMTIYCKKPVAYHSEYCLFHRNKRMHVVEGTQPLTIQRVKDRNHMEPMWIQEDTKLIQSDGSLVGRVNHSQSIMKRFIVIE